MGADSRIRKLFEPAPRTHCQGVVENFLTFQEITYSHFSSHLPPLQLMELFVGEGGITMQVVAAQPGTIELMAELSSDMRFAVGAVVEMFEGLYGERRR